MKELSLIRLFQALVGLAAVQFALPKLLPLPGVSASWLLLFVGGGIPGIIASLVGGFLLLAWGVSLLPPGLEPGRLALLSALAAVASRLILAGIARLLAIEVRLWPGEEPGTGLVLGLALVAFLYGVAAYLIARLIEQGRNRENAW